MRLLFIILLFSSFAFGQTIVLGDDDIRAFPGCEGFGKNTTGARGLSNVYFITNTNESGAGSNKQAWADAVANGGGWIIPRAAGNVTFTDFYKLGNNSGGNNNITYVGQAAPYQGLQYIASATTGDRKEFNLVGSNTIMRHLKTTGDASTGHRADGFKLGWSAGDHAMENIVLDHLSIRGAQSRLMSFSTKLGGTYTDPSVYMRNVTMSNCLLSESVPASPMNMIIYGENYSNISIINNLCTNTRERHIFASGVGNKLEIINNYHYNWWAPHTSYPRQEIDVIGNVYDEGNLQDNIATTFKYVHCSSDACPPSGDNDYTGTKAYFYDNKDNSTADGNADYDSEFIAYAVGARINPSSYIPRPSSTVKDYVVANAGAGANTPQGRDVHDQDQIDDVVNTTGAWQTSPIPIPTLTSGGAGPAYTDTDSDGLSDQYELDQGGTTTSIVNNARPATFTIADGTTIDQSGVTNYATAGYTHLDVFFADLAGDWDGFTPATNPPGSIGATMENKGAAAIIISH